MTMTRDRARTIVRDGRALFYTTEQLGPRRHKTPEGFLVCESVPIARVGEMTYGPGETPVDPGSDGRVYIMRTAKEVFKPDSIASIAGKPIADDHPPVDVEPVNWHFYTKGVVMHPRRGEGSDADKLLADLMIFDPDMIADIEAGKREVSCGYTPEYYPVLDAGGNEVPGRGEQRDIIYNHLALVEKGRCGPRCSIGDSRTIDSKETKTMTWRNTLRKVLGAKDSEEIIDEIEKEVGGGDSTPHIEVHNHMPAGLGGTGDEPAERQEMAEKIKEKEKGKDEEMPPWFKAHQESTDARFKTLNSAMGELGSGLKKFFEEEGAEPEHATGDEDDPEKKDVKDEEEKIVKDELGNEVPNANSTTAILGELEFEAPPGTNDKAARRARDSVLLEDAFQDTVAKAEIIAPGIALPTFDAKMAPQKTLGIIIGLRRTALDLAYSQADTRGVIDAAMSGRTMDAAKLAPSSVRTLFNAVAAFKSSDNNRRSTDMSSVMSGGGVAIKGNVRTIADLNKRNAEKYHGRKSA